MQSSAHVYCYPIPTLCVDSLTHGLLSFYLSSVAGFPNTYLIPAVIGSLFPDIDILFRRLSDRSPRFYVFTHGGFTHSVSGSLSIATILTLMTAALSVAGLPVPGINLTLFSAYLVGSLFHTFLDFLAFPGLPILFPFSSKKYTLGIFPGPSLFIFGVTTLFLMLVATGVQSLMEPVIYLSIIIGFITFRILMKVVVRLLKEGIIIPRMNPFLWYIVRQEDEVVMLESYTLGGRMELLGRFPCYQNITQKELASYLLLPEVRRHQYYSYISIARKEDDQILFFDPLRMERFVWYPPDYVSIKIPLQK